MQAPLASPPLRGIVVREDRDTLVVRATEVEVQRFARQRTVAEVDVQAAPTLRVLMGAFGQPQTGMSTGAVVNIASDQPGVLRWNELLYDVHGRPVARVVEVEVTSSPLETTTLGDVHRQYVSGQVEIAIRARGLPGVRVG